MQLKADEDGTWYRWRRDHEHIEHLTETGRWEDAGQPWAVHLAAVHVEHEADEHVEALRGDGTGYGGEPMAIDYVNEPEAAAEFERMQTERPIRLPAPGAGDGR